MSNIVRDVMHAKAETAAPETSLAAIVAKMKQEDVGAVPIVDQGKLVGIVTDRDIALRGFGGAKAADLTAKDVMSKTVASCRDTDTLQAAAKLMETRKVRRLPVLDAKHALVGMLSLGDMSQAMSNELSGRLVKAVAEHHA
jgi:CBS domain-containing protein